MACVDQFMQIPNKTLGTYIIPSSILFPPPWHQPVISGATPSLLSILYPTPFFLLKIVFLQSVINKYFSKANYLNLLEIKNVSLPAMYLFKKPRGPEKCLKPPQDLNLKTK